MKAEERDEKEDIKGIATHEKVLRYLPPGKPRIEKVYPLLNSGRRSKEG